MKILIPKGTCTPMFIAALFTIAKAWKQHKCPSTDQWIKKSDIYIHNGILLTYKQEQDSSICSNMDRPRDYHIKSDRDRQIS